MVNEPTFNVLEHSFVPEHEVLADDEAKKMLKKYEITKEQLPKIRRSDACIRALEVMYQKPIPEGSIIKITRKSLTADNAVSYRLVIRG